MPGAGAITSMSAMRRNAEAEDGDDDGSKHAPFQLLEVDRLSLVAILKRRAQRARRFRSLPLSLAMFGVFMAAMMTRAGVTRDAYDFDRKCGAAAPLIVASAAHSRLTPSAHPPPRPQHHPQRDQHGHLRGQRAVARG